MITLSIYTLLISFYILSMLYIIKLMKSIHPIRLTLLIIGFIMILGSGIIFSNHMLLLGIGVVVISMRGENNENNIH